MQRSADVIILGLGAMGSAAAYHLAVRGVKLLGFDRYEPAHVHGSSHGGSRIIRQAYSEDSRYVPLVLRAYELWRQLEEHDNSRLLQITGGLHLGSPGSGFFKGAQSSAAMYGLAHEILGAAEIKRRFPVMQPADNEVGLYEFNAGVLSPELAVTAFLRQAARRGADLRFKQQVVSWETLPDGGVRVTTFDGVYHAAKLVIAPGAWASEIFHSLALPLVVRRHVMAWFDPVGGVAPFLPERFPIYTWQSSAERLFYGFPAIDGREGGVKVAMHTGGDPCTPESIDRAINFHDEQELRDQIGPRLPSLNGRLLTASTCMYTMTPDEHFVVGLLPGHAEVTIACGFSGHGFKFASVVGEILADLVTQGTTNHDIAFLAPCRQALHP